MSDKLLNKQEEADLPGERLYLHAGSVVLPADYEDRTTNVPVPAHPQQQANLSIARDWLQAEENLDQYVDRQSRRLQKHLSGYKLLSKEPASLCQAALALTGLAFKNGQQTVWQRQAAFLLAPRRVLIFTAASAKEPNAAFENVWSAWLSSFRLVHNPVPPSDP